MLREREFEGNRVVAKRCNARRARPAFGGDLAPVWGPNLPAHRTPRILGLFAHPDDEVFCVGGTIARCADAGADAAVVSLTRGEAGQIRDPAAATRRMLGSVRATELARSARALGVTEVSCLDLGDGRLADRSLDELAATVLTIIDNFDPDVVVTFGPDGACGHPDHVRSSLAASAAIGAMDEPPRLLHAQFPRRGHLLVDVLVQWLTSNEPRFSGTAKFGRALRLLADGSSTLGFAADHLDVEWFPAGTFLIEQGEPATDLFCILSGSVDVVVESGDGQLHRQAGLSAGSFVGQDGLASGRARNAHVIAREDVTCLVLASNRPSRWVGRGADAGGLPVTARSASSSRSAVAGPAAFAVDVRPALDRKVAALAAHRSQYAMECDLFPPSMLECLLGTEHFAVASPGARR